MMGSGMSAIQTTTTTLSSTPWILTTEILACRSPACPRGDYLSRVSVVAIAAWAAARRATGTRNGEQLT